MPVSFAKRGRTFPKLAPESVTLDLCALEESLLQPDVRKSAESIELLTDEVIEFGSSGKVYTRFDVVDALQVEAPNTQTTRGLQVWLLAPKVAFLT